MANTALATPPPAVDYPASDGQPMAETDHQRTPLAYAVDRLRLHFRDRPDVYVSGEPVHLLRGGQPAGGGGPGRLRGDGSGRPRPGDVPVVGGAEGAGLRAGDHLAEHAAGRPDGQARVYRRLGVKEYWRYDPTNDYLTPPLQGLELIAGKYERLPARERSGGELALTSAVLGLELRLSDRGLRFHDPRVGRDLSNLAETDDERQRAERERSRERQRTEQERQRAEQAESRLAREEAARRAAQARVAELEALLKRAESG